MCVPVCILVFYLISLVFCYFRRQRENIKKKESGWGTEEKRKYEWSEIDTINKNEFVHGTH